MTHWVDPRGSEITEFAGHNDDCGPCANEVCLSTVQGRSPSTAHMNTIRQRDLGAGLFKSGSGQNVYELVKDVQRFEAGVKVQLTPAQVFFGDGLPSAAYFEVVHQALKAAMTRHNACVINLGNAGALPGNERGVQWHFVACIGIDDNLGYLICNGDEIPFDGTPNWVRWPQLLAAKPVAVVEYLKGATPVSNPVPPPAAPPAWVDANGVITAPPNPRDGKSYQFVHGFAAWVREKGVGDRYLPYENEHALPDGTVVQVCAGCRLNYKAGRMPDEIVEEGLAWVLMDTIAAHAAQPTPEAVTLAPGLYLVK